MNVEDKLAEVRNKLALRAVTAATLLTMGYNSSAKANDFQNPDGNTAKTVQTISHEDTQIPYDKEFLLNTDLIQGSSGDNNFNKQLEKFIKQADPGDIEMDKKGRITDISDGAAKALGEMLHGYCKDNKVMILQDGSSMPATYVNADSYYGPDLSVKPTNTKGHELNERNTNYNILASGIVDLYKMNEEKKVNLDGMKTLNHKNPEKAGNYDSYGKFLAWDKKSPPSFMSFFRGVDTNATNLNPEQLQRLSQFITEHQPTRDVFNTLEAIRDLRINSEKRGPDYFRDVNDANKALLTFIEAAGKGRDKKEISPEKLEEVGKLLGGKFVMQKNETSGLYTLSEKIIDEKGNISYNPELPSLAKALGKVQTEENRIREEKRIAGGNGKTYRDPRFNYDR